MRLERKKEQKNQKGKKKYTDILAGLYIVSIVVFIISVLMVNVLPLTYFIILILVLSFVSLIILLSLLKKNVKIGGGRENKKDKKNIAASVAAIVMILITSTGTYYMANTLDFFSKISDKSTTHNFYVIVKADSKYDELKDIDKKTVAVMNQEDEIYAKAQKKLKEKVDVRLERKGQFDDLTKSLLNDKTEIIFMNSAYYEMAIEDIEGFTSENTRIIEEIIVEVEPNTELNVKSVDVTKEPFNIYISGIDTTGSIGNISRSDVNMVMTVNPKTKTILLTSIPRDYYVKLATKDAMDKLTHSGLYGIEETTKTVENLLGIDINYYVKVNFTTVVKLVDTLGGITVNSEYSFSALGMDNVTYNYVAGPNNLNGQAALAFARERYSFASGDNQRVKNQQAVLTGIIKKCTGSTSILTNYNGILNAIEDNIQTSMSQKDITSLVKMQLGDMSGWTIKHCSLRGSGSSTTVYSIPNSYVYVMVPDQESVDEAKSQISSVISE
ncbi:MAG: LCP family protein [Firmicutes bacterium]|jgi:LCP family protein required for cell wall assembly|nr:LCP family protein [Bacillota bacterium]